MKAVQTSPASGTLSPLQAAANPFAGEEAVRIERAVRRAVTAQRLLSVGDVLIELRLDPHLSDADFHTFASTLLEPRKGFDLERWVVTIIDGEAQLCPPADGRTTESEKVGASS
jgi:hypothetical protein